MNKKPMHILYIITSLNGGTGRVLCDVANAMAQNHRVTICELKKPDISLKSQLSKSINMVSFNWERRNRFSAGVLCLRFIRKCWPDVIHSFDFAGHLFGCLGGKLLCSCLTVASVHGLVSGFVGWRRMIQIPLFYVADHIQCVSVAAQKQVEALIGKNTRKVTVVANGINIEKFAGVGSIHCQGANTKFIIGCVADFFDEVKGQHFLIEAVAMLEHRIPNIELWLIGEGVLKPTCQDVVTQCGIKGLVRFWGHRNDIPDLLIKMDVFVMPSLSESFGLALVEAMAMGIPVIGSRVGGIPDIVLHEKTGLLVSAGKPNEIAQGIFRLYENETFRQQLAKAGRARVMSRFDLETMIEGYKEIYSSIGSVGNMDIS